MDFTIILQTLIAKFPVLSLVFLILGGLVVLAQVVVTITPSKSDDEKWEKIKGLPVVGSLLSALLNFAPIQKK